MKFELLGRTRLKVSRIGFGGGALKPCSEEDVFELVESALTRGINIIDIDKTIDEALVGRALKRLPDELSDGMIIAAKSMAAGEDEMMRDVEESLRKLGKKSIEIYQLHLVDDLDDFGSRLSGAYRALEKCREGGKIRFIGLSSHSSDVLEEAVQSGKFDTLMFSYNLGHTDHEPLIEQCREKGIGIIAKKVLGGGFLVDPKYVGDTPKKGAEMMTAENAIKFALSNDRIDCVLIGMNRLHEVEIAASYGDADWVMSQQEKDELNSFVDSFLGKDYCRTCKYCVPCPEEPGLQIDYILRLWGVYKKYGYKRQSLRFYNELLYQADRCNGCGVCEEKCPYHIPIIERLKEAHETYSAETRELERVRREAKATRFLDVPQEMPGDLSAEETWHFKSSEFNGRKRYDLARDYFLAELEKEPNHPTLLLFVGSANMELGEYDVAIEYLEKSLDIVKVTNWVALLLAKCHFMKKQYDRAMHFLDLNLKICTDPFSHFHTWYLKAVIFHEQDNIPERDASIEKIVACHDHFMKSEMPETKPFLEEVILPLFDKGVLELEPKLEQIGFHLTDEDGTGSGRGDLSGERWVELTNEACDLRPERITISGGGGDPFCRPDLMIAMMKIIKERGVNGLLITNGMGLSETGARGIVQSGWDDIEFTNHYDSLEGIMEINRWKRRLMTELPRLYFTMSVTGDNDSDLLATARLAVEHDFEGLHVRFPEGKPHIGEEQVPGFLEEVEKTAAFCLNNGIRFETGFDVDNLRKQPVAAEERDSQAPVQSFCILPFREMVIFANGKVGTCRKFFLRRFDENPEEFGLDDVADRKPGEVWEGDVFRKFRKGLILQRSNDVCSRCTRDIVSQ